MPQNARIAVIGTGWWGTEAHIPAILSHPDASLVAACDRNPERLRTAAGAYDIPRTYNDHCEMLANEDLDGVVIATPHATHYGIARDCLNHDLHVLLEKPMTLYAPDARDLVNLAAERNRALMMGYPYLFLPQVVRAREILLSGELGDVQYIAGTFASHVINFYSGEMRPELSPTAYKVQGPSADYNNVSLTGGGEGHLQITHIAGLMFFVTGLRATRVHALMANLGMPVDVVDAMTVAFDNGALGMIGGTGNAGRNSKMSLTIYCSKGCIDADTRRGMMFIRRADGSEIPLGDRPATSMRVATTHNLIDVILGRAEVGAPGEIGWRTVELLDAAYRSAAQDGQGIVIEDLYDQCCENDTHQH